MRKVSIVEFSTIITQVASNIRHSVVNMIIVAHKKDFI